MYCIEDRGYRYGVCIVLRIQPRYGVCIVLRIQPRYGVCIVLRIEAIGMEYVLY